MTTLATASIRSAAPSDAFFARWADTDTWPEWNTDTAWVRLDGPFREGVTGRLKPKGGPAVGFVVTTLNSGRFTDVSRLVGGRLTFDHVVGRTPDGGTQVTVTVTLTGPLAFLWRRILGAGIARSVQPDLDRLRAAAEAALTR